MWKDMRMTKSPGRDLNEKSIKVLLVRARRNPERILRQNGVSGVQP
jgi:hypothetical protein